jgi:hypothetical protein
MASTSPEDQLAVLVAIRDSEVRYVTDNEGPPIYDVPAEIEPAHVANAVEAGLAELDAAERVGLSVVQEVRLTKAGEQALAELE